MKTLRKISVPLSIIFFIGFVVTLFLFLNELKKVQALNNSFALSEAQIYGLSKTENKKMLTSVIDRGRAIAYARAFRAKYIKDGTPSDFFKSVEVDNKFITFLRVHTGLLGKIKSFRLYPILYTEDVYDEDGDNLKGKVNILLAPVDKNGVLMDNLYDYNNPCKPINCKQSILDSDK